MERSTSLAVALAGVMLSGAAYLPLDPNLPAARLQYMLQKAKVRTVLSLSKHEAEWQQSGGALGLRVWFLDRAEAESAAEVEMPVSLPTVAPDSLLYVMFTSGSTGQPKGCEVEHRGVANHLHWLCSDCGVQPEDRVILKTSLMFDPFNNEVWLPLVAGCSVVIPSWPQPGSSEQLASSMVQHQVSVAQFVPTLLAQFLRELDPSVRLPLRFAIVSGEALSSGLALTWHRRTGGAA